MNSSNSLNCIFFISFGIFLEEKRKRYLVRRGEIQVNGASGNRVGATVLGPSLIPNQSSERRISSTWGAPTLSPHAPVEYTVGLGHPDLAHNLAGWVTLASHLPFGRLSFLISQNRDLLG